MATSIMVFAATPLKPAFTLLAGQFQADNPGATVDFDFATSAELANKLSRGASADVFASADTAQMDTVIKADLASGDPVNFATDTLAIVTAPGDPKQIHSFADLARPDVRVAVCQASAPCGAAAQRIADNTGVHLTPVSEEPVGSAVLAKVTGGEADAGLIYRDDAHKAGDRVDTIRFPESDEAVNVYPIVGLKKAAQSALAQKFVDLVTGPIGQRVLSQSGFDNP
jgi:molybdate transport system substrate-binding protein